MTQPYSMTERMLLESLHNLRCKGTLSDVVAALADFVRTKHGDEVAYGLLTDQTVAQDDLRIDYLEDRGIYDLEDLTSHALIDVPTGLVGTVEEKFDSLTEDEWMYLITAQSED